MLLQILLGVVRSSTLWYSYNFVAYLSVHTLLSRWDRERPDLNDWRINAPGEDRSSIGQLWGKQNLSSHPKLDICVNQRERWGNSGLILWAIIVAFLILYPCATLSYISVSNCVGQAE